LVAKLFCLQATAHLMLLNGLTWTKKKVPKKTEVS
jgi:hypothetical protein